LGGLTLSPGEFAALILGIIAFFVLIGVLLFYLHSKRKTPIVSGDSDTTQLIGKRNTGTSFGHRESGVRDELKAPEGMTEVAGPIYWNKYI